MDSSSRIGGETCAATPKSAATTLSLPYPPSTNRLWRTFRGRMIKSREYRAWLTVAAHSVLLQGPEPIKGAYKMTLIAFRPDRRGRDLGNLEKPVSDLLAQAGLIEDDKLANAICLFWADAPAQQPGAVRVTLEAA